jgi:polyisoprenoid-binding protein YceI
MKYLIILFLFVYINSGVNAQSTNQKKIFADKKRSEIIYAMNHPLHSWTGVNKDVNSVILLDPATGIISQVAVSVKIASFDSQNANRDSHTIEVTEAIKYPLIKFNSSQIKQDGNKLTVSGTLNFHGVNQPITFVAEKKNIGSNIEVTGGFSIKMTQFKVDPPSLMGISTDDEIKLTFKAVF